MKNRLRTNERLIYRLRTLFIYLIGWESEATNILLLRDDKEKGRLCVYDRDSDWTHSSI